jgi:hypothetical protein
MSEINSQQSDSLNVPTNRLVTSPSLPSVTSRAVSMPSIIQIKGIDYEMTEIALNKRGKTSWIWKEGFKLSDVSSPGTSKKMWMCRRCHEEGKIVAYASNSTSHPSNHLRDIHEVTKDGPAATDVSSDIESAPNTRYTGSRFDFDHFKVLLVRWIVIMHISFSQVENEAFRSLLLCLSAILASHLPTSGTTIRNWVMEDFKQRRKQIKKELHLSKNLVHFSFDMWTSPNSMAMIGIVSHFVSHTGEAKVCLLGLRRIEGSHSGENMAQSIIAVIEEYELRDRLGYFMLDNATSNDTCVREILRKFQPHLDPKERRLRCFGHVVNLAAKAFLFGTDPEAFEAETIVTGLLQQEKKALELWRRLGPVGKLQNIVTYIRRTPQRRDSFVKLANDELVAEAVGKIAIVILKAVD